MEQNDQVIRKSGFPELERKACAQFSWWVMSMKEFYRIFVSDLWWCSKELSGTGVLS